MSRRITAGNDAPFRWAVKLQGKPFDLSGKDVKVYVINSRGEIPVARLTIEGHEVSGVFEGRYQTRLGEHSLVLRVNEGRPEMKTAAVANVFELVQWSADAGGSDESDVIVAPVLIESELSIGGGSSYDDTEVKEELARLEKEKADKSELTELSEELASNWEMIEDLQNTKIDKEADDYYPQLSVGTADNLSGVDEVDSEFSFRRSGGGAIADGVARVQSIKGNSVVWNNMVDTRGYEDGAVIREGIKIQQGHKYLLQRSVANSGLYLIPVVDGSENYDMVLRAGEYAKILVSQYTDTTEARVYFESYCGASVISDLTLMFGAGNEPSTIEEYNARKPFVEDEYAYNEGEVIHMNTESIKSIGDNALNADRSLVFDFDGSYGNYDFINTEDAFVGISADGYINKEAIEYAEKIEGGFRLRSNGGGYGIGLFVKALPNEEYSVSYASDNGRIAFGFYDKDKKFISYQLWENRFTTPSNCEYIMLCLRDNEVINIDISFTDIMLTLVHSGWKQDTDAGYQPYWQDTLPLPIVAKYFPNGMRSAGAAHDEIRYNKQTNKWEKVVRIAEVDLGSLDWRLDGSNRFISSILQPQAAVYGFKANTINAYGYYDSDAPIGNRNENLSLAIYEKYIFLYNHAYTDAESFKAAMQGVMLYYELANPIVTEIKEKDFNLDYKVWDCGTEQMVASKPSSALSADITYGFNAVGLIKQLRSMLEALSAKVANL